MSPLQFFRRMWVRTAKTSHRRRVARRPFRPHGSGFYRGQHGSMARYGWENPNKPYHGKYNVTWTTGSQPTGWTSANPLPYIWAMTNEPGIRHSASNLYLAGKRSYEDMMSWNAFGNAFGMGPGEKAGLFWNYAKSRFRKRARVF